MALCSNYQILITSVNRLWLLTRISAVLFLNLAISDQLGVESATTNKVVAERSSIDQTGI